LVRPSFEGDGCGAALDHPVGAPWITGSAGHRDVFIENDPGAERAVWLAIFVLMRGDNLTNRLHIMPGPRTARSGSRLPHRHLIALRRGDFTRR